MTRQWTPSNKEMPEEDRKIIFISQEGAETEGIYRRSVFLPDDMNGVWLYYTPKFWRYV